MNKTTLIISGPTGSGKSALAEELALNIGLEIVNADSFQMYREIPIISNQPVNPQVKYHCLAHRSVTEPTNAGEFSRFAQPFFSLPAIWVGTGLYLGAALYGLDADRRKGTPFQGEPLHPHRMLVVERNRAELYDLINTRVDVMIELGAMAEVEKIKEMVDSGKMKANSPLLKTIGVQQTLAYLAGEISLEKSVEVWKQLTRNLAKRQWTWLRRFCSPKENIYWMNLSTELRPLEKATEFFSFNRSKI